MVKTKQAKQKKPTTKERLKEELIEKGIPFTDSDTVATLKEKLAQANLTETTPNVPDNYKPFALMDAEDESSILAEMQGAVLDKFVYKFQDKKGNVVVGLSKAGVDEVCRESANRGEVFRIMINPVTGQEQVQETVDDKYIWVRVTVGRFVLIKDKNGAPIGEQLLQTKIGVKRQPRFQTYKSGAKSENPFAYEVAYAKAQRNAMRDLIPHAIISEMIKAKQGTKYEKVIDADAKVSEGQMRFIHSVGAEHGLTHEGINNLVKQEMGYESVSDLRMTQVDSLVKLIKERPTADTFLAMPDDIKQAFIEAGIMEAKQKALWSRAITACGGDEAKVRKYTLKCIENILKKQKK